MDLSHLVAAALLKPGNTPEAPGHLPTPCVGLRPKNTDAK